MSSKKALIIIDVQNDFLKGGSLEVPDANEIIPIINNIRNHKIFDYVCCIYPTAPLIDEKDINKAYNLLLDKKYDSVFPIVGFSYPIQRALQVNNNKASMILPENLDKRSQDLQAAFHDAGQFYWMQTDIFIKKRTLFTDNSGAIVLSETKVQDIDSETDWKIAEMKYQLLKNKIN